MGRRVPSLWYTLGSIFRPHNPAPTPPPPTIVNQRVQQAVVPTPQGPVTLRRTITDEVLPATHPSDRR